MFIRQAGEDAVHPFKHLSQALKDLGVVLSKFLLNRQYAKQQTIFKVKQALNESSMVSCETSCVRLD